MILLIKVLSLLVRVDGAFNGVNSKNQPLRLDDMSMIELIQSFNDESTVKILSRLYPNIFDIQNFSTISEFVNVFWKTKISISRIDLSNLCIDFIPGPIVDILSGLETFDLSGNPNIKLDEEWFGRIIERNKISELLLDNCNLTDNSLKLISKIETLERLNISGNNNLNLRTDLFLDILKKLKYLDVSNCNLDGYDLKFIFENGENLVSLNFSYNSIMVPFQRIIVDINGELKNKLELLSLINCNLNGNDLDFIFIFPNLKEIDLSLNRFGKIQKGLLERLFKYAEYSEEYFDNTSKIHECSNDFLYPQNTYVQNLKCILLRNSGIKSNNFVKCLFELEGLESLNLSQNPLIDFNKAIIDCNSKSSLKKIELKECKITGCSIIEKLRKFKFLEYLDVSQNHMGCLSDNFSLGNLKDSLISLNIDGCHWNHNGWKAISECTKLVYLYASSNYYECIPDDFDFKELKNTLKEVYITDSLMNINFLNALTECEFIEKLVMYDNPILYLPSNFSLKKLENSLLYLNITRCSWNIYGLKAISKCAKLKYLYADSNNFQGLDENFEFPLDFLKEAYFSRCKINQFGFKAFTQCCCVEILDVSFNYFDELPQNFTLGLLRNSLKELKINNSGLMSQHLKIITDCYRLAFLDASYNFFSEKCHNLGISKNSLIQLSLKNCCLDYKALRAITDCRKLKILDVSYNFFPNIPTDFKLGCSKESLVDLNINISFLTFVGLRAVTDCPRLERLSVVMNSLNNIPVDFGFGRSKYSLKDLYIGWCNLNASGFKAIADCAKLERVWISRNMYDSIPADTDLESLQNSLKIMSLNSSIFESE